MAARVCSCARAVAEAARRRGMRRGLSSIRKKVSQTMGFKRHTGWPRTPLALFVPLLGVVAMISSAAAALEGGWEKEYLGTDPDVRFYPDANANYWTYELTRRGGRERLGLRIDGVFPDARYMSLSVYDNADLSAVASLADFQVRADDGSSNPFAERCVECPAVRAYTV